MFNRELVGAGMIAGLRALIHEGKEEGVRIIIVKQWSQSRSAKNGG